MPPQVSATILAQSRKVFLGLIWALLKYADPAKFQLAYTGEIGGCDNYQVTPSAIIALLRSQTLIP